MRNNGKKSFPFINSGNVDRITGNSLVRVSSHWIIEHSTFVISWSTCPIDIFVGLINYEEQKWKKLLTGIDDRGKKERPTSICSPKSKKAFWSDNDRIVRIYSWIMKKLANLDKMQIKGPKLSINDLCPTKTTIFEFSKSFPSVPRNKSFQTTTITSTYP